jgi:hypothetical protein
MEYEHSIEDKHSMEDDSTAADVEDKYQWELAMYSMFLNCLGNNIKDYIIKGMMQFSIGTVDGSNMVKMYGSDKWEKF